VLPRKQEPRAAIAVLCDSGLLLSQERGPPERYRANPITALAE